MSVNLPELVSHLDACLQVQTFQDYCPNGLQVEGCASITKIATGVTASQALLDAAIDWGAHAIVVHHGYFWRGESPCIVGMKQRRIAALLRANVSLLAYHLPLDAHPTLGNNARFGHLLGIDPETHAPLGSNPETVGNVGNLPAAISVEALVSQLERVTGRACLHIGERSAEVKRVAWCTGAAQSYIEAAVEAGADLFITGEVSEQTVHIAREEGIHFVAAGHHATERYGVQALGEHLVETFGIEHRFIDIDNPV